MRLGIVKGTVVLSRGLAVMEGTRYLIVEPVTADNLKAGNSRGGGREVVAADHLGRGNRADGLLRGGARSLEPLASGRRAGRRLRQRHHRCGDISTDGLNS